MAIYCLILLLIFLFTCSLFLFKDFINPCSVYTAVWLSVAISAVFFEATIEDNFKLSLTTITIIGCSALFFFMGSVVTLIKNKFKSIDLQTPQTFKKNDKSMNFNIVLVIISLILLPIVLYKASLMISNSLYINLFTAIRANLTEESSDGINYGIGAYGVTISNFNFLLALQNYLSKKRNIKLTVICFLIVLVFDILSTSRTSLFFTFIPGLFIIYVYKGVRIGSVLPAFLLLLLIFGIYNILKNVTILDTDEELVSFSNFFDSFKIYFLGGIYAVNNKINALTFIGNGDGTMLFRTYFAFVNALGFNVKVNELILGYELAPIKTNVYTLFYPYLYDVGIWFMFMFVFILGFIHTLLYKNRRKSVISTIFYALLMYPLFMSFFQDQYFFLLSVWVQYLLLTLFYQFYIKIKIIK